VFGGVLVLKSQVFSFRAANAEDRYTLCFIAPRNKRARAEFAPCLSSTTPW